jgi:retinol-binding protein 3
MRRSGITAALFVCMVASTARAQGAPDLTITPAYRSAIIDSVAARLGNGYFNQERASFIRAQLANQKVRKSYDTLTSGAALTAALSRDLKAWSGDRHLNVLFSAQARPLPKSGGVDAEMAARELERARSRNFGFHALERLTGNIGYLEIGRFEAAELAGATLNAAMQFLANTDALIIDLRGNGGGHADMVALMASYFLAEQTRLATLERRNARDNDQIWSASYVPGPRYLDRPVFVLTSSRTFSGAEGLTYDLKHFAHATVVGEKTRGGANPGGVQQIDEHFAVFVPTARVVHAATGTNWDADGITPDVAVAAADAKRTALKLALEKLIASKPDSGRSGLWREAYVDMFPTAAK